jgi:hypothetical protein
MVKKLISIALALASYVVFAIPAYAQSNSYTLKATSSTYKAFGTVSISRSGSQYSYSAVVKDLPSTLPSGGVYYLLWGLTPDGKADNLGPITNNSENKGNLNQRVSQFFITSEKERYPEYVSGPKVVQTETIPESAFTGLTSASPAASSTIRPSSSSVPVGGPTGAPETGFGGAMLWNGAILSLGLIGVLGLSMSLKKKFL